MVDDGQRIVTKLTTILPTYLEFFLDSNSSVPCISYFLSNNVDERVGDDLSYSRVTYIIKVWDHSYSNMVTKSELVDDAMKELGYRRESSRDMVLDSLMCRVLTYKGLGQEID